MTEHSAVIFVFFFLAEYASIVLICMLTSILYLGGYNIGIKEIINFTEFITIDTINLTYIFSNIYIYSLLCSLVLGVKTCIIIFLFIWVRASFPRIRFDQLMTDCWTIILPIIFAYVIFVPCLMWTFDIIPNNIIYY